MFITRSLSLLGLVATLCSCTLRGMPQLSDVVQSKRWSTEQTLLLRGSKPFLNLTGTTLFGRFSALTTPAISVQDIADLLKQGSWDEAIETSRKALETGQFRTLLAQSAQTDAKVFEFLLNKFNVDPNQQLQEGSLLHYAIASGSRKPVRALLAHGVTLSCKDKHGKTPAQYARNLGFIRIAQLLERQHIS